MVNNTLTLNLNLYKGLDVFKLDDLYSYVHYVVIYNLTFEM